MIVIIIRVATFALRLNSLCFPCVHDQFPCVFQYTSNMYHFINGLHHPLQPSFPPFYSTITLQVKSPCQCVATIFPVFSLSGNVTIQIPCFPCALSCCDCDKTVKSICDVAIAITGVNSPKTILQPIVGMITQLKRTFIFLTIDNVGVIPSPHLTSTIN